MPLSAHDKPLETMEEILGTMVNPLKDLKKKTSRKKETKVKVISEYTGILQLDSPDEEWGIYFKGKIFAIKPSAEAAFSHLQALISLDDMK